MGIEQVLGNQEVQTGVVRLTRAVADAARVRREGSTSTAPEDNVARLIADLRTTLEAVVAQQEKVWDLAALRELLKLTSLFKTNCSDRHTHKLFLLNDQILARLLADGERVLAMTFDDRADWAEEFLRSLGFTAPERTS